MLILLLPSFNTYWYADFLRELTLDCISLHALHTAYLDTDVLHMGSVKDNTRIAWDYELGDMTGP